MPTFSLPPLRASDEEGHLPPLRELFPDLISREESSSTRRASFAAPGLVPIMAPMRQRSHTDARVELSPHTAHSYPQLPTPIGQSASLQRSPRKHPYALPARGPETATRAQSPPLGMSPAIFPSADTRDEDEDEDDAMDIDDASDGGSDPERRHACERCGKRFNRPSSLRTHLHTHTGSKPYRCPHPGCGRSFNVNSNMRRHYRTHGPHATRGGQSSRTRPESLSASPPSRAAAIPGSATFPAGAHGSAPEGSERGARAPLAGPGMGAGTAETRALRPLFAYAPRKPPGAQPPPAPREVSLSAILTAAMG